MTRANDWHKNLSTQTPNTLRYSGVLSVRTILAVVFRPFPERPRHTLKTWKVFPGHKSIRQTEIRRRLGSQRESYCLAIEEATPDIHEAMTKDTTDEKF
ncbi:hypothetical protein RUM44_012073 [Polyplax serrata]|uniref:Uncharacterized protein n=1 Tax=Polyplax serrata TaxID=468196 RepID=A0ABR1BA96_POLSC